MGWVTLSLRKQTLQVEISELDYDNTQLTREKRAVSRHLSYETSVFESDKAKEISDAKAKWDAIKAERPSVDDQGYAEWKEAYADAKEQYESDKCDIEDFYDDLNADLEAESKIKEEAIEDEKTINETQRQAMQAELDSLKDEVKTEIQNTTLQF